MTSEFIRLAKTLRTLSEKTTNQKLESFGWHFITDEKFEKISVKIEFIYRKGFENLYFYINKNEMKKAKFILQRWMDFEHSLPRYLEIPEFTNKRDLVRWLDGQEFLEVVIKNDEIYENKYHLFFDLYEDELHCVWKGEYEELNKILNSLCDLYLIHVN